MSHADLLHRAAALLEAEAEAVKRSCRVGETDWICADCEGKDSCPSKLEHAILSQTAKELKEAAREK